MNTCPYVCNNKTIHGYCMSTACINPLYNRITVNQWLEKADYVQVVRCKDCKHSRTDDVFGGRWCQKPGSIKLVREDFFCADGERKDT